MGVDVDMGVVWVPNRWGPSVGRATPVDEYVSSFVFVYCSPAPHRVSTRTSYIAMEARRDRVWSSKDDELEGSSGEEWVVASRGRMRPAIPSTGYMGVGAIGPGLYSNRETCSITDWTLVSLAWAGGIARALAGKPRS